MHEVLPVTKGKRYVIQSFLFDNSGYEFKKIKNGLHKYILRDPIEPIPLVPIQVDSGYAYSDSNLYFKDWKLFNNKIIPPTIANHYLGSFNNVIDLMLEIKKNTNITYFIWYKPNYNNPQLQGRVYIWINNCSEINNLSNTHHNELNVLSGHNINYTDNSNKYLSILPVKNGAGNQVIGIKEALLMANYLKRQIIFPPIFQHYILNINNRGSVKAIKYWNFNEIYKYDNINDNLLEHLNTPNFNIKTIYYFREDTPSDIETIIMNLNHNKNVNKRILPKCSFKTYKDYNLLKNIDESVLLLNGIYNNTSISTCRWNGCDTCAMNEHFYDDYKIICGKFDFSDKIKRWGDEFIKNTFDTEEYITLHIRYHDFYTTDIKMVNKLYNEADVHNYILDLCKIHDIKTTNIFIATSNQEIIKSSPLNKFNLYNPNSINNELESFIEQYICCKSKLFIYTGGIHAKPTDTHLRSTWSSFVIDYRNYLLKKENKTNIYLTDIFTN